MTKSLVITAAAKRDIEDAFEWYASQNEYAARALISELDRQFRRIAEAPGQFPMIRQGVRRALVRRFPFLILFREEGEEMFVIACFHGRRDPPLRGD